MSLKSNIEQVLSPTKEFKFLSQTAKAVFFTSIEGVKKVFMYKFNSLKLVISVSLVYKDLILTKYGNFFLIPDIWTEKRFKGFSPFL